MEDLTWMPAWQMHELVVSGSLSPVEITEHRLGRIERLTPMLQAFAHIDFDGARKQALRSWWSTTHRSEPVMDRSQDPSGSSSLPAAFSAA
jgi:Asp-tRNA(Asn)/Glu-tRNA(Gln) amidotransferase A subunit family amidase